MDRDKLHLGGSQGLGITLFSQELNGVNPHPEYDHVSTRKPGDVGEDKKVESKNRNALPQERIDILARAHKLLPIARAQVDFKSRVDSAFIESATNFWGEPVAPPTKLTRQQVKTQVLDRFDIVINAMEKFKAIWHERATRIEQMNEAERINTEQARALADVNLSELSQERAKEARELAKKLKATTQEARKAAKKLKSDQAQLMKKAQAIIMQFVSYLTDEVGSELGTIMEPQEFKSLQAKLMKQVNALISFQDQAAIHAVDELNGILRQ